MYEDLGKTLWLGKGSNCFQPLAMSRRENNLSEGRRGQGAGSWELAALICMGQCSRAEGPWLGLRLGCRCLQILNHFSTNGSTSYFALTLQLGSPTLGEETLKRGCDLLSVWPDVCWLELSTDQGHIWSEILTQMPQTEKKIIMLNDVTAKEQIEVINTHFVGEPFWTKKIFDSLSFLWNPE